MMLLGILTDGAIVCSALLPQTTATPKTGSSSQTT